MRSAAYHLSSTPRVLECIRSPTKSVTENRDDALSEHKSHDEVTKKHVTALLKHEANAEADEGCRARDRCRPGSWRPSALVVEHSSRVGIVLLLKGPDGVEEGHAALRFWRCCRDD